MQQAWFRARLGGEYAYAFLSWAGLDADGVMQTGQHEIGPSYVQAWASWKYWTLRAQRWQRFWVMARASDGRSVEYTYP